MIFYSFLNWIGLDREQRLSLHNVLF